MVAFGQIPRTLGRNASSQRATTRPDVAKTSSWSRVSNRRAAACANDMAGSAGGVGALRQDDAVVWAIINDGFCSHKVKIPTPRGRKTFCKHPNNVTGLCRKQSCPLANTRCGPRCLPRARSLSLSLLPPF